jgi:adenylate cyclase
MSPDDREVYSKEAVDRPPSTLWNRLGKHLLSPSHGGAYWRGLVRSVATGLLVTVLSILVAQGDLFRTFELKTLDTRFRLRGSRPVSSPLSIIFIGDDSIEAFGRWPWSWDYHALLVDVLSRAGAKMVLFDILFSENPGKQEARFLADMSRSAGNVYFCTVFNKLNAMEEGGVPALLGGEELLEPIAELRRVGAGMGHCNAVPDLDGTTRRVPMLVRYREGLLPSAPLLIAADAMGATVDETTLAADGWIELQRPGAASVRIPVDDEGQTTINFNGGMEAFDDHSFRQVIQADQYPDEAALDLSVFKDRIVLVGTTFAGNTDLRPTPFAAAFPMFLTQAALIDNILQEEFVRQPPYSVSLSLWLLIGALIGGLTFLFKPLVSLAVSVLTGVGYLGVALLAFSLWSWNLDLVGPLSAVLWVYIVVTSIKYFVEEKKARSVRRMFSNYATERVVNAMIADPNLARLGGERREVTVLFSDIRGFTTFSEANRAEDVVAMLNEFLGEMTDVIFRWEGTLDKFIGDAIVAFWGAPLRQKNHSALALRCALAMSDRLARLQEKWIAEGKSSFSIGIGINTGEVIVGNIGAEGKKMDYTVIGDSVNLGARVESLTKDYGCQVMLTEYTLERVGQLSGEEELDFFSTRELGRVLVKGKKEPVTVYQLLPAEGSSGE